MNQKNLLLTVLACLNCVHTTHAVESTLVATENNGQFDIPKLRVCCALQEMCLLHAADIEDAVMAKDAIVKQAQSKLEIVTHIKEDVLLSDDSNRSVVEVVEQVQHEVVNHVKSLTKEELMAKFDKPKKLQCYESTLFEKKLQEPVETGKIKGVEKDSGSSSPYTVGLYKAYPILEPIKPDYSFFPNDIRVSFLWCDDLDEVQKGVSKYYKNAQNLTNEYPDIAYDFWNLCKEIWASSLNGTLPCYRVDNLGTKISNLKSDIPELGCLLKDAVVDRIQKNLIGEDQDLKATSDMLLENDPELKKMVLVDPKMPLVKIMKDKTQTQGSFKKMANNLFREIAKYL